ncbi:hypothetical protein [Sulfurimonas xiamenensis]|uniref:Uncharacterized protein n=1 Tax=Sulfurimonas xiamenensis TaxID=2590021 RepID=A0AAJ4DM82_9BACT|nr:hypothetical protein [Sulfurimonas xiamenensis]QFR42877.1 hypothetical protein FJR47_02710 [Sulfurimonas xiamenensis]
MGIESIIKELSREELEGKFINMFNDYSVLKNNHKNQEEVPLVDFSDFKIRRRQQYLHKTYSQHAPVLNGILKLYMDTQDKNLHHYLSELNAQLEKKAQENNDFAK